MNSREQRRVWSNTRIRFWLCAAVGVLALALTAQTVHVMVTPTASGKHIIDAARHVPVLKPVNNLKSLKHANHPAPQADFRPLLGASRSAFDPKTSKETARDEKSVTYTNRNGSHSVRLSQTPISVRDSHGAWVSMDTRVVNKPNSTTAVAARDGAHTEFAATADDPKLLQLDPGDAPVSLALTGAHKAKRTVHGSTVTYPGALPGQDLTYTVEPGAVKEAVVVKNAKSAGAGRWVFTMALGNGLAPKLEGKGVSITNAQGTQVAALPPIQVFDSANKGSKDKKKTFARTGGTYSLARKGEAWALTVSVNKSWLTDKKRVYPVTVDPTYTYGSGNTAETRAYSSGSAPECDNTCGIEVGNQPANGASLFWRSGFRFDFSPLFGKTVVGARMDFQLTGQTGTSAPAMSNLYQAGSPLGYNATGNLLASASIGTAGSMAASALTSYISDRVNAKDTNAWFLMTGGETSDVSFKTLQANLIVDYGTAPPATTLVGPVDQAVIATPTPTLSVNPVTNPSGDGTLYCFKVSTGFDGRSGSVVDSGCLTNPTWTVPAHVLHDGGKYTWTVLTALSGGVTTTTPQWVAHFTINQRIGETGKIPVDTVGDISVNLFNGNVHTDTGGPQFTSVGGKSGVALAYNSRQGEANGVRASYFNDPTHTGTPGAAPVLVRTEPQVNLDWGNVLSSSSDNLPWKPNPIPPALDPNWYVIRWEGQFRPPVTGDFRFDGQHADGARIWVNNTLVYDNPNGAGVASDFSTAGPKGTQDISLTAGVRVPIKVELYHHTNINPQMVLWTRSVTGGASARSFNLSPVIAKTDWLFSNDPPPLPNGWNLSIQGSEYSKAEMLDGSVVLTDGTGATHTWAEASDGDYVPPADEDGVLAVDNTGKITVTQDDVVSIFNPDGTLTSVASVLDSKKPAALQYQYSGTPPRLTKITDPVSGRSHTLSYNTDNSDNCYGGATKPPGAIGSAPAQMLCRITYWDGTETRLWYSIAGTLDRVENPGGAVRDYTYDQELTANTEIPQEGGNTEQIQKLRDAVGPLIQMRTPLINDWLATPAGHSDGLNDRYIIAYDSFYDPWANTSIDQPSARPTVIQKPTPDANPSSNRESHSYQYGGAGQYWGNITLPDVTNARKVTFDTSGRALTSTDADGVTNSTEWTPKDKVSATVDGAGRRATVVYDYADRPTDSYGPAPASCFNGQTPTAQCAGTMPYTHVGYDEGLTGLSAALYSNPVLSGIPAVWQTGVGTSDGSLSRNWTNAAPVANTGGWSARFTGEIQFPAAGAYGVGFTAVDGVRLWIDDALMVDSWTDKPNTAVAGSYTNTTAGSWHRVRVDYYNRSGTTGALNFTWTPPGAGSPVTVPGQFLQPRYGWQTSQTDYDSSGGATERAGTTKTATSYSDPANGIDAVYGLVVAKTSDPGGLSLVRRNTYETPGAGYLRKTASALPSGDITNPDKRSTTTYYGDAETRANPCDSSSTAVSQAGMAKFVTAAKNAAGQSNTAESVYDGAGQVVASRVNSEPWTCTSYDARGRTTQQAFPAQGNQPARTVTYNYAVNGDPRTTTASDSSGTVTTVVDLLGRPVSYTDANGVVTTTGYDRDGRVTGTTSTVKGVTSTLNYTWDNASRLLTVGLDGTTVGTTGDDNGGQVANVAYGNGSRLDSIARNAAGATTGLTWKTASSTVVDSVTRSSHGRITDENLTDTANPTATFTDSYTYDGVGRLAAATVPHHQLTYHFDPTGGCGPNTAAGMDTNRTGLTDVKDGGAAVTTGYCYDNTDRLLSTNGANALSFAYDVYGNATNVGTDTLGYDSTLRHVSTSTASGTNVAYTRDANDRLMARTVQGAPTTTANGTTRYGYTAPEASNPELVLDSNGNLQQRVLKLSGGVVLTKTYGQTATTNWSYPDVHGSILFTADGAAARTGVMHLYDPYGQNIDPGTGVFGDIPIPATMQGGMDFGWLGQNTLPIEHLASQQAVEIGARTYLPVLGRFLQTDPVTGGSSNDYDYVNADPVNNIDLTGKNPLAVIAPLVPEIGEGLGAVLAPEIVIPAVVLGAGIYAIEKANDHRNDPPATSKPNTAQAPDKAAPAEPPKENEPEKPANNNPKATHDKSANPAENPNLGALKKVNQNQLGKMVGDAHEFKEGVLGRGAKVSRYDVYIDKDSGWLFLEDKNGGDPIPTYHHSDWGPDN
ncbi:hypothetical protein K7711_44310 [Nocardia sp. CA2R105]|uniref:PA14 domain-containing protein n=1 Tax=Nocardia coffeae TaxID=2873381 RepID=UPI001CA60FC7|nr:PA14 domain-containing protein [Nocardia coffeae]MBY8863557.1 hypothetical protein [Nocardia coffeae]